MKKLSTILVLLLIAGITSGQTFLRATRVDFGVKKSTGIAWEKTRKSTVLLKMEPNKLTIYSKADQVYRKIGLEKKTDKLVKWLCADYKGRSCYVMLTAAKDNPGVFLVAIEYNDIIWFYTTHTE